jgi:MFS family permease
VGFWLPDLIGLAFEKYNLSPGEMTRARSYVFLVQMFGALLGMFSYAALSERIGRRPALAIVFVLAFCSVQLAFRFVADRQSAFLLAPILGFCTLAPFSACAVYFPELFPTRLRATGVGFCYNCARILAATAPFLLGTLAKQYAVPSDPAAGLRTAASIVACIYFVGFIGLALTPETRGKPLPD